MTKNLFETQYDLTKKNKFKIFYDSNKKLIFSIIFIFVITSVSLTYYSESNKKKRILLSEDYIKAKVYLENGEKNKAIKILKKGIYFNDPSYSVLCFFLILDANLIEDFTELSILFNHLLENNKFEKETENLLIYKKAMFNSNFATESALIEEIRPLLDGNSLWKPHALMLLGDYFTSKKEYTKAREFYSQILIIENIERNLFDEAKSKLLLINND
tara:strand:+ start:50 stop:697 length:648 start_codon:yes stop_codon:yes gene_type:complete